MKKWVLLLFVLLSTCYNSKINAQDCKGYEIQINNPTINKEDFLKVFSTFNYEKFRPKYLDYTMHFNFGIEVKLIAIDKLKANGCSIIEMEDYPSLEYLQKNINYFKYNMEQKSILAVYNLHKK